MGRLLEEEEVALGESAFVRRLRDPIERDRLDRVFIAGEVDSELVVATDEEDEEEVETRPNHFEGLFSRSNLVGEVCS